MNGGSDIVGLLRGMPFIGELDDEALSAIASTASLVSAAEGDVFYCEDGDSYDVYFVVSGVVAIWLKLPNYERYSELLTMRSGSLFGALSFLDGARRDMRTTARERSLVLRFDGPLLKAACASDPKVGRAVYRLLGAAAARNARDISIEMRNLLAERA